MYSGREKRRKPSCTFLGRAFRKLSAAVDQKDRELDQDIVSPDFVIWSRACSLVGSLSRMAITRLPELIYCFLGRGLSILEDFDPLMTIAIDALECNIYRLHSYC